ncbi:MAG TPA: hypothetical protein VEK84_18160, partial [Terriglobales bacterium]|nr:hypothetical protein [Terriglobales bacterium]
WSFVMSLLLLLTLAACSKPADKTAANPADQNTTAQPGAAGGSAPANNSAQPQASQPPPTVVPAGTALTVRLREAVGSKISQPGQSFSATLSSPVAVEGYTVIPAGAAAQGVVVDAKPLGRFKGGAVLELRLSSVTVNGSETSIQTSAVTRTEKGKGKRTAVMAGGGAAVGALIGGLAGGGKGAAIGAVAGGGAGTGGAAFTGNKDIVLPAESAVSFRLKSPLEVLPAR